MQSVGSLAPPVEYFPFGTASHAVGFIEEDLYSPGLQALHLHSEVLCCVHKDEKTNVDRCASFGVLKLPVITGRALC